MTRAIWACLASLLIALAMGPKVLPWLKKMKFGQTEYDLGPDSHKQKQGTPTMGGVLFAVPMLVVPFIFAPARGGFLLAVELCMLGFGLVGFVDDYIKVSKKRSLGLTPMQKIAPQVVISLAFAIWAYCNKDIGSTWVIPFTDKTWNLSWLFIPATVFVMVGIVNSANLLDGVDGLLGSCAGVDFAVFSLISFVLSAAVQGRTQDMVSLGVFCASAVGAVLGFLFYNAHPAKVFMGDVGAFTLGGAVAGWALVTGLTLYIPLMCMAMLLSSLSDIIQIGYFKITHGKRVFRMAPLHHHFELGGMPETRIVEMYTIGTIALCLLALIGFVA